MSERIALTVVSNNVTKLARWISEWERVGDHDEMIIVEDSLARSRIADSFSWAEMDCELGGERDVIPRQCPGARLFAFLKAIEAGCDYIVSLDDDCFPVQDDFCKSHMKAMSPTKWARLVPGHRTSGIPYQDEGQLRCHLNIGLWSGLADLDCFQLVAGERSVPIPTGNTIVPAGQYLPLASGNFCFHRDLAYTMYLPRMGGTSPFTRFDDMWAGVIMKKVCDHLGLRVSCGLPIIEHRSGVVTWPRVEQEIAGIKAHEWFWRFVDGIQLAGHDVRSATREIGSALSAIKDVFFSDFGGKILRWTDLVDRYLNK